MYINIYIYTWKTIWAKFFEHTLLINFFDHYGVFPNTAIKPKYGGILPIWFSKYNDTSSQLQPPSSLFGSFDHHWFAAGTRQLGAPEWKWVDIQKIYNSDPKNKWFHRKLQPILFTPRLGFLHSLEALVRYLCRTRSAWETGETRLAILEACPMKSSSNWTESARQFQLQSWLEPSSMLRMWWSIRWCLTTNGKRSLPAFNAISANSAYKNNHRRPRVPASKASDFVSHSPPRYKMENMRLMLRTDHKILARTGSERQAVSSLPSQSSKNLWYTLVSSCLLHEASGCTW